MSEVIDQMLEQVEIIPLPRKDKIIKILLEGKKAIQDTDKEDTEYYLTYEQLIQRKLNYYKEKVRKWKETEFRHIKDGKRLGLQIKLERIQKKFAELKRRLQQCSSLEEYSSIEQELKKL